MNPVKTFLAIPLLVAVAGLWAAGCDKPSGSGSSADGVGVAVGKDRVTPPKEYYAGLMQRELDSIHVQAGGGASHVLFLEFSGAALEKGFNVGQSFLACADKIVIPPALVSETERAEIARLVQGYFAEVKAAVTVVVKKPATGDYTTVMVGGSPRDLECKGLDALDGIAPFDIGNVNPSDIVFVFTRGKEDIAALARSVAHEAAHSYGLDHVDNPKCLMSPAIADLMEGFRSGAVLGGKTIQDAADLLRTILGEVGKIDPVNPAVDPVPGADLFAEIAKLMEKIGVDPQLAALLRVIMTEIDKAVPGGIDSMPGMDKVMAILHLVLNNVDPNNPVPITPANAITVVLQMIEIITGKPVDQSPWLTALTEIMKQVDMTAIIASLNDLFQKSNSGGGQLVNIADLQTDGQLAGLLGLTADIQGSSAQVALLQQQKAYINTTYKGETRIALLSLLKAGHMEAFVQGK